MTFLRRVVILTSKNGGGNFPCRSHRADQQVPSRLTGTSACVSSLTNHQNDNSVLDKTQRRALQSKTLNFIVKEVYLVSEHHEETRQQRDKLWDKTFADNEDLDSDGHLSRTEHRRQRSHNSMVTTVLIVLIIILAAAPVIYWVNNKQSFNHPLRTEQQASSSVSSKKKASQRSQTSAKKHHRASSSSVSSSQSSAASITSSSSISSSQTSRTSSIDSSSSSLTRNTQGQRYVTVQRGESVYRIAERNGISAQELARLNNMTIRTAIHPGQQLRVR